MENAIEHNDSAEPWVRVTAAVEDGGASVGDGAGAVHVRVADGGPGILPEEVAVLERGEETSFEHTSGLGLWLVHWIVTASGGEVRFDEREPHGSVVEFVLPRADSDEA